MGQILAGISMVVELTDRLLGSKAANSVMERLGADNNLTTEQMANLQANYRDYIERIARLKAEIDS